VTGRWLSTQLQSVGPKQQKVNFQPANVEFMFLLLRTVSPDWKVTLNPSAVGEVLHDEALIDGCKAALMYSESESEKSI
jgi:hypothetical protein